MQLSIIESLIPDITETLLGLLCGQTESDQFATWGDPEWKIARVVAVIQGIAPRLAAHADVFGQSDGGRGFREFVLEQYHLNQLRNERMSGYLRQLLHLAHERQIVLMPLKGADVLFSLYDDIALRPMADFDLFAPPAQFDAAAKLVCETGFDAIADITRHAIFALPPNRVVTLLGEHPDNPIKLELHHHISDELGNRRYDLTELLWKSATQQSRFGDIKAHYPDRPAQMAHLLLHLSAHMLWRTSRFVSLYDLHLLIRRFTQEDWEQLQQRLSTLGALWWTYPPLRMLNRYYHNDVPDTFLEAAGRALPTTSRQYFDRLCMTGASYCSVRSGALGHCLRWALTPLDALQFVRSLVAPSREVLQDWNKSVALLTYSMPAYKQHYVYRLLHLLKRRPYRTMCERMFGSL